jgi:hypothetical protein
VRHGHLIDRFDDRAGIYTHLSGLKRLRGFVCLKEVGDALTDKLGCAEAGCLKHSTIRQHQAHVCAADDLIYDNLHRQGVQYIPVQLYQRLLAGELG